MLLWEKWTNIIYVITAVALTDDVSKPPCIKVGDAACEFPSLQILLLWLAMGRLTLSHFYIINAELQPEKNHDRFS